MKIVYWNMSKESHPMYAMKKYEDELYENIISLSLRDDLLSPYRACGVMGRSPIIERIQRSENRIFGNTFFSWIFRYKCKDADIVHGTFQTVAP
ncbi:MAG: hypothetical protein QMD80_09665, partial [archaeon]|nr:hypothetical protein [archaeon]